MKKVLTIFLVLALVMSLSAPAFAANQTEARTDLSYMYVAEPEYTVTIPGTLKLDFGRNSLYITVSDANYLAGKRIEVTLDATQDNRSGSSYFNLWKNGVDDFANAIPYYVIVGFLNDDPDDPDMLESGFYDPHILNRFTGDGTKEIFISVPLSYASMMEMDVPYTGHIVFGIKLV